MSRPPRPHFDVVTAKPSLQDGQLDYLPLEYGDLLELSETLAAEDLGLSLDSTEGNLTRTLFQLSSLVGHVLAVYQDRYAGEAFLRTANARSSLVRHARRLAHTLDVGLSATGYVALMLKNGLTGTIDAGLELASARVGDVPPQTFETLASLEADAALNELFPADATRPVVLAATATSIPLDGIGHGLNPGDLLALVGGLAWQALLVAAVHEDRARRTTHVELTTALGTLVDFTPGTGNVSAAPALADEIVRLLVDPSSTAHSFGWNADPTLYPQTALQSATGGEPKDPPAYWYEVDMREPTGSRGVHVEDHYLARVIEESLVGDYVVQQGSDALLVSRVAKQLKGTVTLARKVEETFNTFTVAVEPDGEGGFVTTTTPVETTQEGRTHLSATATALEVHDHTATPRLRASYALPLTWFGRFRRALPVASQEPNPLPLADSLDLSGVFPGLAPGRRVIFSNLSGTRTQAVQLTRVQLLESEGKTRIFWQPIDSLPPGGYRLDDLKVLGNVAQVIHGRTQREVLGDSDGVTPFQRFVLRMAPVSMRPEANGAAPQIELRVHDVTWQRVVDFFDSGPEDRHFRLEVDEQQRASVVFGDGVHGAIPPAGTRNIAAAYKVGLGPLGNVAPLGVSRIKSPQPLLDRAFNPGAIAGGTAMADLENVRSQATRYIRTFDRAVSVQDHADLALLYPGVVRSAARWDEAGQKVVLVAASADGGTPPGELAAFLEQRRDTEVPLEIVAPSPRAIALALSVEIDPAFLFENVRLGIHRALLGSADSIGLFTFAGRELGQPAYSSEVQAAIEAVDGVIGASILRFGSRESTGVFDVIQARVDQWLSLSSQDLSVQKAER